MNFSKILKKNRIEKGMSQQELAEAAGVTKRAICYWEQGTRNMTLNCADRVFKALGTSITIGAAPEQGKEHTG